MTRSLNSPSAGSTIVGLLQPYEGGTGQSTAAAALAALGGVPAANVNQPNGVAGLGTDGKLATNQLPLDNLSVVSLQGNINLVTSSVNTFNLTNFDSFSVYAISVSAGSYTIADDVLTYYAPATAQTATLTINGRTFSLNVATYFINDPTLSVVDVGSGSSNAAMSCNSSAFALTGTGGTHLNTDWQVATDAGFTNIVSQSLADATNKTSWTSGALNFLTTYYTRVRYRDSNSVVSNWSNVVQVTTKATYVIQTEEAKIVAADKAANTYFGSNRVGYGVSITADGSRVVVGEPYDQSGRGSVYVFTRSGNSWTQEAKFFPADAVNNSQAGPDTFGAAVSINGDGTRIAASSPGADIGASGTQQGKTYVYVRNTTTNAWTQEALITVVDTTSNQTMGIVTIISQDGTRVFTGSPNIKGGAGGTAGLAGAVYVFSRSGSTWTQEAKIIASDGATGWGFATSASVTTDATRIIVGSYNRGGVLKGAAYIYLRTGTSWAQEAVIVGSDSASNDQFGYGVAISGDGTRVSVGANGSSPNSVSAAGSAYVFSRSGTTWTQEAKFVASDKAANDGFGDAIIMSSDGSHVYVGVRQSDPSGLTQAGAAYSFVRTGTSWAQERKFTASDQAASASYGSSIALSTDNLRLVIAAPQSSPGGTSAAGSAYIYR